MSLSDMDPHEESSGEESELEDEIHDPRMAEDSDDSDKELRAAFESGFLKPGMYREHGPERPAVNNVEGMQEKLEDMELTKMDWLERLDVTVTRKSRDDDTLSAGLSPEEAQNLERTRVFSIHNDFKRELMFLNHAKDAVLRAIPKLKEAGIPTVRPDDYFAEMAKKDDHMKKIREKLLSLQRQKEKSEKFRNQLKLKKHGKKVQQAVEADRRKKKKEILNDIKKYQMGKKGDSMDFLDDDDGPKGKKSSRSSQLQQQKRKKSRSYRDKKFGYGGRKKGMKLNTSKSTNDVSGFRRQKPQGMKSNNKRLGKGRRQKMKNDRR